MISTGKLVRGPIEVEKTINTIEIWSGARNLKKERQPVAMILSLTVILAPHTEQSNSSYRLYKGSRSSTLTN